MHIKTKPQKILIVDDDEMIISFITKTLENFLKECEVWGVTNGFQAGHLLCRVKPHLVILDIMLPGVDGFRICDIIKKLDKDIKILAITGYDTIENRERMLKIGANGYLTKPFDKKEIICNIKNIIG